LYNSFYHFTGPKWGLTYKFHVQRFIIEPKFQLGFEYGAHNLEYTYKFKEIGSNNYLDYSIQKNLLNKHQNSYHWQLNIARRFNIKSTNYKYEVGIRYEYFFAPYDLGLTLTEHPSGQPASVNHLEIKEKFQVQSYGAYIAFYLVKQDKDLKKKHPDGL
jgi:hypothetical protein